MPYLVATISEVLENKNKEDGENDTTAIIKTSTR